MSQTFNYVLDFPQPEGDFLLEVARSNDQGQLSRLDLPILEDFISEESLSKVDEGSGGSVVKVKCSLNRQTVIVKVLKQYTHFPSKSDKSTASEASIINNLGISTQSTLSKNTTNSPIVEKQYSYSSHGIRVERSHLSSVSSVDSLSSSEVISSSHTAKQLEEPLFRKKDEYIFDSLNEYLIMRKLNSKFSTPVYGLFTTDNHHQLDSISEEEETLFDRSLCFMMDYYPDLDLLHVLSTLRKLAITVSLQFKDIIFHQVAQGLKFIHSHGIAHRDIKPENVLVDPQGCLRICDFGYAVDTTRLQDYPTTNLKFICRGTNSFKAPELLKTNNFHDSTTTLNVYSISSDSTFTAEKFYSSDIWALGILFYQIKFLKKPWLTAVNSDPDYLWYCMHYKQNKLESISNGYDIKRKFPISAATPPKKIANNVSGGFAKSSISHNSWKSNPASNISMNFGNRQRSSSVSSMNSMHGSSIYSTSSKQKSNTSPSTLRVLSSSSANTRPVLDPSRGDAFSRSFKTLKDECLHSIINILNPEWEKRPTIKEILKSEWLLNVRISMENEVKNSKTNETEMIKVLKMIRKS